jgi:hypothetical protein
LIRKELLKGTGFSEADELMAKCLGKRNAPALGKRKLNRDRSIVVPENIGDASGDPREGSEWGLAFIRTARVFFHRSVPRLRAESVNEFCLPDLRPDR